MSEQKLIKTEVTKSDWVCGESVGSWLRRRIDELRGDKVEKGRPHFLATLLSDLQESGVANYKISENTLRRYVNSNKYFIDNAPMRKKFSETIGLYGYSDGYFDKYTKVFDKNFDALKRIVKFVKNSVIKNASGDLSAIDCLKVVRNYISDKLTPSERDFVLDILPVVKKISDENLKDFNLNIVQVEINKSLLAYFEREDVSFCQDEAVLKDAISIYERLPGIDNIECSICRNNVEIIDVKKWTDNFTGSVFDEFEYLHNKSGNKFHSSFGGDDIIRTFYITSNAQKTFGAIRPLPREKFAIEFNCCRQCFYIYKNDFVMPLSHVLSKIEMICNLSQEDIADEIGVKQSYISIILKGGVEFVREDVILEIYKCLFKGYRQSIEESITFKNNALISYEKKGVLREYISNLIINHTSETSSYSHKNKYKITENYHSEPYGSNGLIIKKDKDIKIISVIDVYVDSSVGDVSIAFYIANYVPEQDRKNLCNDFFFSAVKAGAIFFAVFYGDEKNFEVFEIVEYGFTKRSNLHQVIDLFFKRNSTVKDISDDSIPLSCPSLDVHFDGSILLSRHSLELDFDFDDDIPF